jgi:2-polyprenyl-6-methoxyphenol hydroxylase-like FAD-dependent oxidoreductase
LAAQFALFRNKSPLMDSMLDALETTFSKNDGQNSFFTKNYYLEPLQSWYKSRVVLMGEAAHLVGPLLGSASKIVFEGAYQLALSLFKTQNHREAFPDFQIRHQSRTKEFLGLEREFFAMFEDKTSLQRMERYLAFNQRIFAFLSTNIPKAAPISYPSQQLAFS